MPTSATALSEQYPRTLAAWLKSDEKKLAASIKNGLSVLEIAEDLQREHISVLNHLNDLDLLHFDVHTEEWVQVMGLALCGLPLSTTMDWCNNTPNQPIFEDIEDLIIGGHLLAEFELARVHHIFVANICAVDDLCWLTSQPETTQSRYRQACTELTDAFEIITPTTLKNQILGIKTPALARQWSGAGVSSWNTPSASSPTGKRTKHYRRKASTSTRRKAAYFGYKRKSSTTRKKARAA